MSRMILVAAMLAPAVEDDIVVRGRAFEPVRIDYDLHRGAVRVCRARNRAQPADRVREACSVLSQCVSDGARHRDAIAICVDEKLFARWKAENREAEPSAM